MENLESTRLDLTVDMICKSTVSTLDLESSEYVEEDSMNLARDIVLNGLIYPQDLSVSDISSLSWC